MSRSTPMTSCNHRFDKDSPAVEANTNASGRRNSPDVPDHLDVISSKRPLDCSGEQFELRKLDEASVDACFSRLSDLLADVS